MSLGADGGLIATGGQILTAPAERVDAPVDTTGAGDLLAAAYIWADLRGAEPIDRLRWAVLYASLGVTTPTGVGGAQTEAELVAAGTARGLRPPPLAGGVSAEVRPNREIRVASRARLQGRAGTSTVVPSPAGAAGRRTRSS